MTQLINALLTDEDGLSAVEFSLFVGALMMAGMGFLMVGAGQLMGSFMGLDVWEILETLPFADMLPIGED